MNVTQSPRLIIRPALQAPLQTANSKQKTSVTGTRHVHVPDVITLFTLKEYTHFSLDLLPTTQHPGLRPLTLDLAFPRYDVLKPQVGWLVKMAPDAFGEINRKFWDEHANAIFKQGWVKDLCVQVSKMLRSNVDWLDIRKPSDGEPPTKMIDYACGDGVASFALFDEAQVIRGVDISDSMVDAYNEAARRTGVAPSRMSAARGNVLDPDVDGNVIGGADFHEADVIVMCLALHHIENPEELLSKLVQRLRSNGVVVIIDWMTDPSDISHVNVAGAANEPTDAHHTISKGSFSAHDMHQLLAAAGCSPGGIDVRPNIETSHIPESVSKVKGGRNRTLFMAKGRKP
ncbi:S-adenosyl-L-methionine-dependent methyltransferase [Xylaria acuta]|nr:S-adenosyl-L-methionine-dependent methyltransferase [Xylaria acuta]